jgi:pilus assembly protein CpaB
MNRRLLKILIIAFVIAGLCIAGLVVTGSFTWLVYRLIGVRVAARAPVTTSQVVAAANDIPLGAVITAQDVTTITINGSAPKGAILKPEDAVGRGVVSEIYQGEMILDSRLIGVGSGGGLAATVPQGMRARVVRVDEVVGVAGLVLPGMRVDVLVLGTPPGQNGGGQPLETQTLLRNIEVLSVGTDVQKDSQGKLQPVQVVTLLVTPEQAETLSLAASSQKIQLVLRNPPDTKVAEAPGKSK